MHQGEVLTFPAGSQVEGVANAPLDTHPGVDRTLGGDFVRRSDAHRAAFTDVWALGVLANDDEVVFRVASRCRAEERSLVDVEVEVEAHLQQQPALDHPRLHVGMTDGAEEDAVEGPQLVERRVAQDLAVFQIPGTPEMELRRGDVDSGRPDDLDGLCGDVRSDAVASDHCNVVRHTTSEATQLHRG